MSEPQLPLINKEGEGVGKTQQLEDFVVPFVSSSHNMDHVPSVSSEDKSQEVNSSARSGFIPSLRIPTSAFQQQQPPSSSISGSTNARGMPPDSISRDLQQREASPISSSLILPSISPIPKSKTGIASGSGGISNRILIGGQAIQSKPPPIIAPAPTPASSKSIPSVPFSSHMSGPPAGQHPGSSTLPPGLHHPSYPNVPGMAMLKNLVAKTTANSNPPNIANRSSAHSLNSLSNSDLPTLQAGRVSLSTSPAPTADLLMSSNNLSNVSPIYPQLSPGTYVGSSTQFSGERPIAAAASASLSSSSVGGAKVALTDAFSYLDRVKAEFENQPEVYNRFLQVMRDFKNNDIDATGVIGRVVQLFRGHSDLILGFNTFLPRTHHIDPGMVDLHGPSPIPPYPPLNSPPPHPSHIAVAKSKPHQFSPHSLPQPQWTFEVGVPPPSKAHVAPASMPTGSTYQISSHFPQSNSGSTKNEPNVNINKRNIIAESGMDTGESSASTSGPSNLRSGNAQFSKAISYVKKVKHRFANDPDSYKSFLSALHSFHRDQRSVQDVYLQVTRLFQNHSDLLDEFMQFLPEGSSELKGPLPPMGQFVPAIGSRRGSQQASGGSRSKYSRTESTPIIIPSIDKTKEELDFFEKAKNYIGNQRAYAEFLKCLNLYSQDILRQDELIKLVSNFIGGDLLSWFKKYIGYKPKKPLVDLMEDQESSEPEVDQRPRSQQRRRPREIRDELPPSGAGPHDIPELNLSECKRIHGSYRLLPTNYKLPPATGRDDIGREVLNDSLLCCASFEREDSTFVSSRKNIYEEALFRCEDERFELDLLIEGNRATLAVLEPIAKRLESMTKEERDAFRLDSRLNGHSAMIYRRNLHRIYGDKADAIMEALQKRPAIAIPVVLKRLRQKDEEWRQHLREWNGIWRTVHLKNYYKALDHQGIDFKTSDRRNLSMKSVMSELNGSLTQNESHETIFDIADHSVQSDTFMLIEYALKHSAAVPVSDRKSILGLMLQMKNFFPASSDGFPRIVYFNNTLMAILRMIQMAIERLGGAKAVASSQDLQSHARKVSVVATFLELPQAEEDSPTSSPLMMMQVDGEQTSLYASLLELTKSLFLGHIDLTVYEERIRFMFGTAAYPMYTFDRLVHILLRTLHQNVLGDVVSEGLLRLHGAWGHIGPSVSSSELQSVLANSNTRLRLNEWTMRLAAENIVGISSGPLFRTSFVGYPKGQMLVQLVHGAASTALPRPEEVWSAYVDEFVTRVEANPRYVDIERNGPVFLGRCLRRCMDSSMGERFDIRYRLECKICLNTFRLLFVAGTEDFMFKRPRFIHVPKINSPMQIA